MKNRLLIIKNVFRSRNSNGSLCKKNLSSVSADINNKVNKEEIIVKAKQILNTYSESFEYLSKR